MDLTYVVACTTSLKATNRFVRPRLSAVATTYETLGVIDVELPQSFGRGALLRGHDTN
jgi:hypothetical protein